MLKVPYDVKNIVTLRHTVLVCCWGEFDDCFCLCCGNALNENA